MRSRRASVSVALLSLRTLAGTLRGYSPCESACRLQGGTCESEALPNLTSVASMLSAAKASEAAPCSRQEPAQLVSVTVSACPEPAACYLAKAPPLLRSSLDEHALVDANTASALSTNKFW